MLKHGMHRPAVCRKRWEFAVQIEEESWGRNLVMDTTKLERFGIRFDTTQQGIQRCFKDYGLRTL